MLDGVQAHGMADPGPKLTQRSNLHPLLRVAEECKRRGEVALPNRIAKDVAGFDGHIHTQRTPARLGATVPIPSQGATTISLEITKPPTS
eukprot:2568869-Amphidinium_carterae.1